MDSAAFRAAVTTVLAPDGKPSRRPASRGLLAEPLCNRQANLVDAGFSCWQETAQTASSQASAGLVNLDVSVLRDTPYCESVRGPTPPNSNHPHPSKTLRVVNYCVLFLQRGDPFLHLRHCPILAVVLASVAASPRLGMIQALSDRPL